MTKRKKSEQQAEQPTTELQSVAVEEPSQKAILLVGILDAARDLAHRRTSSIHALCQAVETWEKEFGKELSGSEALETKH